MYCASSVVPEELCMTATELHPEFHVHNRGTDGAALCAMSAESYGVNRSNRLCRMNVCHEVAYCTSSKTV
jgi:hypothetical protein